MKVKNNFMYNKTYKMYKLAVLATLTMMVYVKAVQICKDTYITEYFKTVSMTDDPINSGCTDCVEPFIESAIALRSIALPKYMKAFKFNPNVSFIQ